MTHITESSMTFGPLRREHLFHVEESEGYSMLREKGLKTVEFIYYNPESLKLIFLEAKTSFSNPDSDSSKNFEANIDEIVEKFSDALDLYLHQLIHKKTDNLFNTIDYNSVEIRFFLVVKIAKRDWIKNIHDALNVRLQKLSKIKHLWKPRLSVFNEELARKWKLLQDSGDSFWQ